MERFIGLDASAARRGEPFDADLVRGGRRAHVAADRTLLEVLREEGVEADSSREGGVCRTCSVHLLGREPVHRDLVLPVGRAAGAGDVGVRARGGAVGPVSRRTLRVTAPVAAFGCMSRGPFRH
ncbi:2Fe-2S iron-sulfur cluster binding domain-containing protein [Actinosynnema sp. NPDC023658]|uniref:2Fe-2S iron-sulfur cluster binding domain-containing protein n=1 Tax=Actinosynnema sp. NPDC023658 TaxID=3155465 RepID=UPI0033D2E875